ncbi:MAG: hypothetical protein LAO21_13225 [Acidobacteriia bacterium]|nr:hypothetical protein [Terriglobia bacterium]
MIRRFYSLSILLLLLATLNFESLGQTRGMDRPAAATLTTLEGVVQSVSLGIGQGFPSFVLGQNTGGNVVITTGPYYLLMNSNFEIRIGDQMNVRAFPSVRHENTYTAVELKNLTTATVLVLRDDSGMPLWRASGQPGISPGRRGEGARNRSSVQKEILSFAGVVETIHLGIAQGFPTFALKKDDGAVATILTGPYSLLLENNFPINVGDRMEVRAFLSILYDTDYVAVELLNRTTGDILVLRDDEGWPLWTSGRR